MLFFFSQTLTLLEVDASQGSFPSDLKLGREDVLVFRYPKQLSFPDSLSPVRSHESLFGESRFAGSWRSRGGYGSNVGGYGSGKSWRSR